jgi:hypothetical protein
MQRWVAAQVWLFDVASSVDYPVDVIESSTTPNRGSPEGLPTAAHPLTTGVPIMPLRVLIMPLRVLILGPTALPAATWLHLTSSHHDGFHASPSVWFDSCRAAAGDTLRIMLPAFAQVCPFADECMYAPSLASRASMPAAVPVRAARRG